MATLEDRSTAMRNQDQLGLFALLACLAGPVLGIGLFRAHDLLPRWIGREMDDIAPFAFLACEAAALILGALSFRTLNGRSAIGTALLLTLACGLLLG